jgi:hypothetical protein
MGMRERTMVTSGPRRVTSGWRLVTSAPRLVTSGETFDVYGASG